MKLHVMSDIHFEFFRDNPVMVAQFWDLLDRAIARDQPDVAVLAGDIYSLKDQKNFERFMAQFCSRYKQVAYVPGNHEYWRYTIAEGNKYLSTLGLDPRFSNLNVLRSPNRIVLAPLPTIAGGTLWYSDCGDTKLKKSWCDYWMVYDSATEIQNEHEKFVADHAIWASQIVVSHHYPTDESIAARWAGQPTNVFFSARIDKALQKHPNSKIKLWIHGHTHDPMDFVSKYGFRVYCNPHGYPGEGSNRNFWDRLLVEVP